MSKLQDNQFERLSNAVLLSKQSKNKMKHVILNTPHKQKSHFMPKMLSVIVTLFVIALTYNVISDQSQGQIIDDQTPEVLPEIEVSNGMFTMEWLSDSMDRGDHDLKTDVHGNLVVSKDVQPIERGDILYYQMDQQDHIGRAIGLPGETVEIREGQVYIDNKKLDTFYGAATSLGLTEEVYFERVNTNNINVAAMEEYFNTSMDPVLVEENTVFVLVDMWWRGKDSRDFGLITADQIQGKILGYEKK